MKSAGSRGRVRGCLVLTGGFGVESEPTLRILSLTSSPALDRAEMTGDAYVLEWLRFHSGVKLMARRPPKGRGAPPPCAPPSPHPARSLHICFPSRFLFSQVQALLGCV